jgi:hypothetical protein
VRQPPRLSARVSSSASQNTELSRVWGKVFPNRFGRLYWYFRRGQVSLEEAERLAKTRCRARNYPVESELMRGPAHLLARPVLSSEKG